MITVNARAVAGPRESFKPVVIERRDPRPGDIVVDVAYSGICHTDVSRSRAEFGTTTYPLVPGHEIAGVVSAVGQAVTTLAVGDRVGIGCMVDSCRDCDHCRNDMEPYCREGHVRTYNCIGRDGEPTQGGYSEKIVVDARFAVRIPDAIGLAEAAPLLCAGITLYSPLRHWNAGPGRRVAIVGFGGLGHVGVSISAALGASTTVLEIDPSKRDDALRRGAVDFRLSSDPAVLAELAGAFDLIVSTVPADLDYDAFLRMLDLDGVFVNLGVPRNPVSFDVFSVLHNRRSVAGTLVGGMKETQQMLDFCAEHGIAAEVEVIDADEIDAAYDRLYAGDVRYRFVIDARTLG